MALSNNGRIYTWGMNSSGQVGDNTVSTRPYPVRLRGAQGGGYMGNVIGLAAGDAHGLLVRSDGSVYAWGNSQNGRLGLGSGNLGTGNRKLAPEKRYHQRGSWLCPLPGSNPGWRGICLGR